MLAFTSLTLRYSVAVNVTAVILALLLVKVQENCL